MGRSYGHSVNLKQYRKHDGQWQFVPVARKENGEPDPRYILIDGQKMSSQGGVFYLDWREGGRRKSKKVGNSPREALDEWKKKSVGLAGESDDSVGAEEPAHSGDTEVKTIDTAIVHYLEEVKAIKGERTYKAYQAELRWFRRQCRKHYVSELSRQDMMALFAKGRTERSNGKPLSQRTINKRVMIALMAMRNQGAKIELRKGDWPKTSDKKIEIYEPEELKAFFDACTPDEKLLFRLFLFTGFRDREVANLEWSDVDLREGKISVAAKSHRAFTPKSYEMRSVPVPHKLIESLRERKKRSASTLVFPSVAHPTKRECKGDKPNNHLLETCKGIAFRSGLNCGRCTGSYTVYEMHNGIARKAKREYCCATSPRCSNWFLHKFRHTFATNMLQSGVDIRSLQVLMGHKNIATTEKYVKSLRLDKLRDKIEASTLAAFA